MIHRELILRTYQLLAVCIFSFTYLPYLNAEDFSPSVKVLTTYFSTSGDQLFQMGFDPIDYKERNWGLGKYRSFSSVQATSIFFGYLVRDKKLSINISLYNYDRLRGQFMPEFDPSGCYLNPPAHMKYNYRRLFQAGDFSMNTLLDKHFVFGRYGEGIGKTILNNNSYNLVADVTPIISIEGNQFGSLNFPSLTSGRDAFYLGVCASGEARLAFRVPEQLLISVVYTGAYTIAQKSFVEHNIQATTYFTISDFIELDIHGSLRSYTFNDSAQSIYTLHCGLRYVW